MYRYKRLFAVAGFLLLLLTVFELSGLRASVNLAYLRQKFLDNFATGLLIFVTLFALGNLIQIPGLVFLAAAVLALGEFWGGMATYLAAVVSCTSTFWLIRLLGGDALRELDGKWPRRLLAGLDANPVKTVTLLRVGQSTVQVL